MAVIVFTLLGFTSTTGVMRESDSSTVMVLSFIANVIAIVGALVAMRWRRKYPVAVTVVLTLVTVPLPSVWAVASWAYLSLCTHRRWRATVLVGLVVIAMNAVGPAFSSSTVNVELQGSEEGEIWIWVQYVSYLLFATMFTVALAAIGSYLGARRDARAAIEERLAAAERERSLVEENTRVEERNRIAREMHDVLAHKISLISMHAGALAYRDDLSREEIREAAQTIEDSSHQALNELRVILGQLRQTDAESAPTKPQPTLADLADLVAEHRAAGRRVDAVSEMDGEPTQTVSRHAYRVLQEALTNAAKHAPGTPVHASLTGGPVEGLTIRVRNPLSVAPADAPGAGMGLIGLEERAELVGGRITSGPDGRGNFEVEVWMPW